MSDFAFADGNSDMGFVMNDRFSATYAWDMHHEHPVRSADDVAWRQLHDYCVFYAGGQAECEAALRAQYGAPQPVADRIRYGPFFISVGDGGRFNLEWYRDEPDWAMPAADPEERLAQVRALVANGGELTFKPPMPARELARALGRPDAIGRSTDVHLSHWVLAEPDGEQLELLGRRSKRRWTAGRRARTLLGSRSPAAPSSTSATTTSSAGCGSSRRAARPRPRRARPRRARPRAGLP